ncbi:MAG: FtsW/RodA/SpoVE family cell cycle protein [Lentimicrobiaceae bacterium]|jgi:cell division protein FtsW|nr:FtsW/RodA/SpoVE family cell cycle protein [Lentimicrobiaceae bacterium]
MIINENKLEETKIKGNYIIWSIIIFLSVLSVLVVYSASLVENYNNGSAERTLLKHIIILLLGLAAIFFIQKTDYRKLLLLANFMIWVTVILLGITMFFGKEVNDARRTIQILGLSFQPSELAKVTIAIYLAKILTVSREKVEQSFKSFLIVMLPVFLSIAFIAKENLSTGLLISAMVGIMLFFGKVKWSYIFMVIGAIILLFLLYIAMAKLFPDIIDEGRIGTWIKRIGTWIQSIGASQSELENTDDIDNYQKLLGIDAIKNGRFFGKMPGRGVLLYSLPYASNDFIFDIIVEEYGFLMSLVVVFMYVILLYRAIVIATKAPQTFGAFLAIGLMLNIVIQVFAHIGVNVGLLPVTGIPLPFVSKGGSSMLMMSIAIGLILSVANRLLSEKDDQHKDTKQLKEIKLLEE